MQEVEIKELEGRLTGNLEENEKITLKIIPIEELYKINDAKTLSALALYYNIHPL